MNGNITEILVVGAGSVGGFFGGHLARFHQHISFLLRPATLNAVKEHGLTIRSTNETFTIHPRCASDPKELPTPDLIILGTKIYDLKEVLTQITPVITDRTLFLTLQNGVTVEDEVQDRFGRGSVIGGVAFIYSRIVEPGVIDHFTRGTVMIGEMMGEESPRLQAISDLFKEAGISCGISSDIRRAKWEKMCWNCVFNPLTVLINDRVAKALDQPNMSRVIRNIVEEVCAVAMAHRVPLDENMAEKVVRWSQELRDIHTSMFDDWKAGRPTEIEALNGYIVKKGREFGIPTPMNEMLWALIQGITTAKSFSDENVSIEGEVLQPLQVNPSFMRQLPVGHQVPDVDVLVSGMQGAGIRVKALLEMATPHEHADHVTFCSRDGQYAASLTLDQAKDFGVLVYELDGQPLPLEKGGPIRLITPGLGDLCANVKDLGRIQLSHGSGTDTRPSNANC